MKKNIEPIKPFTLEVVKRENKEKRKKNDIPIKPFSCSVVKEENKTN